MGPQRLEPTAHNGLVGGSNPSGPTTQSFEPGDFPETAEKPALGGLLRLRFGLRGDRFWPECDFGRLSLGRGISFPRCRSIWPAQPDHGAGACLTAGTTGCSEQRSNASTGSQAGWSGLLHLAAN